MMGVFSFLMLIVGGVLLFNARSRLKHLEWRLRLVEEELRRRIAAGREILPPEPKPEPEDLPAAEPLTQRMPPEPTIAAPPPEPEPHVEPEPVAILVEPAMTRDPQPTGPAFNFEDLFGRKLPIWAGGITLAIAGVLIVKYAIDIGLFGRIFTPGVQAICGLLFGLGLIGGAEWAHANRERIDDPRVAQALSGAGISTLYAAVLVAANAYHLISPLAAFLGLAVVTALALILSLRHGTPSALLGLAGGLAAPALTVGITANVPMLAIYLAFTIAGLVGVSRAQRWPWLALIALIGGAGWSLWLILAGQALGAVGSLSIGLFVIMLAVAAPLFAFEGARGPLLRTASALVGAAQLALLVAMGGFAPLDWGLFALIAAASQWLAWRDQDLRLVPTIGAALSALLLLIWPDPDKAWLLAIGLALAAIHAGPLLARLWWAPARVQRAVELSAIAVAAPIVALWHAGDDIAAWVAAAAALVPLSAAALGWKADDRRADSRFVWLIATGAGLSIAAALLGLPQWQQPLWGGAVTALVLLLARPAQDARIAWVAAAYALLTMLLLPLSDDLVPMAELQALVDGRAATIAPQAVLRWLGVAAMAVLFAWRADRRDMRDGSSLAAAGLLYGLTAQFLPLAALPFVAPLGLLALATWARSIDPARLRGAMVAAVAIVAAWAFLPWAVWTTEAARSLLGMPMVIAGASLAPFEVASRLLVPALLVGGALWLLRAGLPRTAFLFGAIFAGVLGGIAVHCFYRLGFAAAFGDDFVRTGLAERTLWSSLIITAGYAVWKRAGGLFASHGAPALVGLGALHVAWYGLILHNPLWSDQAVGAVPLANLLLPLFAALPLCIWLIGRMLPEPQATDRILQPTTMVLLALFVWASLRQAFHGSLLAQPGLPPTEDILRSILGIVLAVGYLLWGIRSQRRDWRIGSLVLMLAAVAKVFLFDAKGLEGLLRIGSFVALGFSLIGIGWLYSRQLRREVDAAS